MQTVGRLFAARNRRINVNVTLRKGETDSLGVESFPDLVRQIPVDAPVVTGLDPRPAEQIDGRIRQLVDTNVQCRLVQNKSVLACNLSYLFHLEGPLTEAMERLLRWVEDGRIRPPQTTCFPLDQVAQAHQALESAQTVGKLILVP